MPNGAMTMRQRRVDGDGEKERNAVNVTGRDRASKTMVMTRMAVCHCAREILLEHSAMALVTAHRGVKECCSWV
jgi:hypothetical protein